MEICGIDEAGRGALAGPLAVAACVLKREIVGLNDSKKLTAKQREELFKEIVKNSEFLIAYFSNEQIDELGLSECLRRALRLFKAHFADCELLYDGNANHGRSRRQGRAGERRKHPGQGQPRRADAGVGQRLREIRLCRTQRLRYESARRRDRATGRLAAAKKKLCIKIATKYVFN